MLYQTICLGLLALGVVVQGADKRFCCALACFVMYAAALAIPYNGGYVYFSSIEFVTILVMYLIGGRLAFLIMALCTACIFVNMVSYWIDFYADSTLFNEASIAVIFAAQMALIFSRTLTDGVYRCTTGSGVVRYISNPGIKPSSEG